MTDSARTGRWIPDALRQVSHSVARFQARLLLTALYIVVVAPFGLVVRCFADPLRIKRAGHPSWQTHQEDDRRTVDGVKSQF